MPTGLRPARRVAVRYLAAAAGDAAPLPDSWPPGGVPAATVYDQAGCEGCYAYAIASCLTLNSDDAGRAAYIDILQSYTDPFYGCDGGYVAGDDVALYMATHGVAWIQEAEERRQCLPSCADANSNGVRPTTEAREIKKRCAGRRWTTTQECMREQFYGGCCWPQRPRAGPRIYADWRSTNSEKELMRHFADGRIRAAVLSLGVDDAFFDYQYDASSPHPAWLPLATPSSSGSVTFHRAFVAPSSSYTYLHAVVAVGWVQLTAEQLPRAPGRYWILQNSWSSEWGADGYCLVAAHSVLPTVSGANRNEGIVGGHVDSAPMYAAFPLSLEVRHGANALFANLANTKQRYWLRVALISLAITLTLGLVLHRYWYCLF